LLRRFKAIRCNGRVLPTQLFPRNKEPIMATEFNTPCDICRANVGLALRMLTLGQEWREHACTLEKLRVERDLDALRQLRESVGAAKDWNEFNANAQTMLHDYFATSSNIWQQGMGLAVHNQIAFGESLRDALKGWQSAWAERWQKAVAGNAAGTPMHEWMQRFGQTVASAPDAQGVLVSAQHPSAQTGVPTSGARTRIVRGE
jgi:hypothetical protein